MPITSELFKFYPKHEIHPPPPVQINKFGIMTMYLNRWNGNRTRLGKQAEGIQLVIPPFLF